MRSPSSLTSSGSQPRPRRSSRRRRCGCGSEKSQVPPASQLSPSRHSTSPLTAVALRTSSIVFRFMSGSLRSVVERPAHRLRSARRQQRGPDFPGRAGRQVTCVRALSHATTLIPIQVGNERLRPANVKCDATLHLKSAERKRAGPVFGT